MAEVILKSIRKVYKNNVLAVDDIDLSINDGEFVCLLGPSGCGKSTTLRMIAGLENITGGDLIIGDRVVNTLTPKERDIAMAFENYALYPHLSVGENIAFPLRIRKVKDEIVREKVIEAAELMGIRSILNESVKDLSGGAQQRTGVARALVRNPQVLLLDEPISHLEEELKARMREDLKKLQRKIGVTTIYVTHDQIEAMVMADRIAIMNFGVLQQFESASDVFEHPSNIFVGGFIGEPPMNFLPCEMHKNNLFFENNNLYIPDEIMSSIKEKGLEKVVVGIRDTHVAFVPENTINSIKGEVVFIEPRNEEQIITVKLGSQNLLVSTGMIEHLEMNQSIWFQLDHHKLNFFNPETEKNLSLGSK
ncbi:MAG: ABC transporter ATP-binding protein [Spirochaetales bacterium]|nr:ABC transporter ATP-binding protein [Spirochaetales bacterium]